MTNIIFYHCETCGIMVALFKSGGEVGYCCGHPMATIEPNTTVCTREKHVPVAVIENNILDVCVGSTMHPMQPEHYIECITIDTGNRTETSYLKPGFEPKAEFAVSRTGTVYAYCSIHGLWGADF